MDGLVRPSAYTILFLPHPITWDFLSRFPSSENPGYRHTPLIFTLVSGNDRFLIRTSLLQSISVQGSPQPRPPPFPMIPVLITCVDLDVPASTRRTDMVHFHALYVLRSVSRSRRERLFDNAQACRPLSLSPAAYRDLCSLSTPFVKDPSSPGWEPKAVLCSPAVKTKVDT